MSDELVRFLRDDVRFYIAVWEGEFACDDADHKQANKDKAKARQAADRIEALGAAINAALERLDASLFTNAEHQQAKDILREATK